MITGLASIELTGIDEVKTLCALASDSLGRKILADAMRKVGQAVTPAMKAAASSSRKTGTLQQSIGYVVRNYSQSGTVVVVAGPRRGFSRQVMMGKKGIRKATKREAASRQTAKRYPVRYAHLVEGGTKRGAKPKPFVQPTLNASAGLIQNILATEIDAGLDRELGRHA